MPKITKSQARARTNPVQSLIEPASFSSARNLWAYTPPPPTLTLADSVVGKIIGFDNRVAMTSEQLAFKMPMQAIQVGKLLGCGRIPI